MSLGQLLAVNETVKRKGNEDSPFQSTHERVVPEFGEPTSRRELILTRESATDVIAQAPTAGVDYGFEDKVDGWSTTAGNHNRRRSNVRHMSSLGSIPIMRNDLTDSDFLLVPQRPPVASRNGAFQRVIHRIKSLMGGSKNGR